MPTKRRRLAWGLAAACFLAAAFLIEYGGGRGLIPTWDRLHSRLGVEIGGPAPSALTAGPTTVTFLDVGQGDAVLIGQDGEYCLVDTGTPEAADDLLRDLRLAGVDELRLLVLTHPHADHIGGALALLQAIPTRQVLISPTDTGEPPSARWQAVLRYLDENAIPVIAAEAGQEYPLGGGLLTVLLAGYSPPPGSGDDAVNDGSVCFRFTAGEFSYLATGDAELDAEAELVAEYGGTLRSTLLKAGHHGSATASSEEFLQAVQPRAVVFSCGLHNEYGHPHAEVLRRCEALGLAQWRTDLDGTVTFTYGEDGLQAWGTAEEGDRAA